MKIKITFRTPSCENAREGPTIHERTLEDVPHAEAEQMAQDFVEYRNSTNGAKASELYRYDKNGSEVLVALDFEEVVALMALENS